MSEDFGDRLRRAREALRLKQSDIATAIGVSLPTVRLLEGSEGQGKLGSFEAYAKEVGLHLTGRSLPPGDTLQARLAALRARMKLPLVPLAQKAGVSATSLTSLERGEDVRLATVVGVAEALGARLTLVPIGSAPGYWEGAATSSQDMRWTTPGWIIDAVIRALDGIDLDPCSPLKSGPVPAALRYTPDDDGLSKPWLGKVFCNPPYGKPLPAWIAKAIAEHEAGRSETSLLLVPARPDNRWWYSAVDSGAHVWFLRKRVHFGVNRGSAPFPSAFFGWGVDDGLVERMRQEFPTAWHVPGQIQGDRLLVPAGFRAGAEAHAQPH